jgi:hypothetical protein
MTCMRDNHSHDVYNAMQDFISVVTNDVNFHIVSYFETVIYGVLLKENPIDAIVNHNWSAYDFFKS